MLVHDVTSPTTRRVKQTESFASIPNSVLLPKSARKLKPGYCIFVQKSVTLYANGIIHLIFH